MPTYTIAVTRVTCYEIQAASSEEALERFFDGESCEEVTEDTTNAEVIHEELDDDEDAPTVCTFCGLDLSVDLHGDCCPADTLGPQLPEGKE